MCRYNQASFFAGTLMEKTYSPYRWYLLVLVVLTNMLVVAIPAMGMSVLAKEISGDLRLNLVQVGVVWGAGALPGIATGLLGGAFGDKLGPKRILVAGVLLTGLMGAARGLANSFVSMATITILLGALVPFITMNGIKTCGMWFPPRQLGLATGLISMGMALGFLLGSLFSATVLSPALGGWRNVLILYGLAGACLCLPWFFTRPLPAGQLAGADVAHHSILKTVTHVSRVRNVWLLGLTLFGVGGCIQGLLGYLPLYLRTLGWDALQADGALSAFHLVSMLFVLPIALWSDRLGSRKLLLFAAALLVALGSGLLSVAHGGLIWGGVLMAGLVRDAFMAIFLTMVVETGGVGPAYAGTAIGFTMAISGIGSVIAPPLGNSLAAFDAGAPFAFWAALAIFGTGCLVLVKKEAQDSGPVILDNALEHM